MAEPGQEETQKSDPMLEDEEEVVEQVPDMSLAQKAFQAQVLKDQAAAAEVMAGIKEKQMAPWYQALSQQSPELFPLDEALLASMQQANQEVEKAIQEKHDTAVKDAGDMEVLDALFERARHFSRIGDRDAAYAAYGVIGDKPKISTGKKIDALMEKVRVGLFHQDMARVKEIIEQARKMVEAGGDWDRRNRLKVYESFYLMTARDLKGAAKLLLDCVATFTCTELCSYQDFIFYAVVTNVLVLPRTKLKEKIVDGPEVLAVLDSIPNVGQLVRSLYHTDYRGFFEAMVNVNDQLAADRYLSKHVAYIVREMRILAYTQFLDAYKSVILASMAKAFGVSETFLDRELSRFISAGCLNAKIDKVAGVVETNRPDRKNAQYLEVIKQGDLLLNRVQKLARVIDV